MARKKKRVSPWVANMRAHLKPVEPLGRPTSKEEAAVSPKLRRLLRGCALWPKRWCDQPTDAATIQVLARELVSLREDFGRWPNWRVRGWRKDRQFKRAMRRAKVEVEKC